MITRTIFAHLPTSWYRTNDGLYSRIHEDEVPQETPRFSAWKWLKLDDDDNESSEVVEMQQRDDALYVLGVAGLASKKLLQKHQISIDNAQSPPQGGGSKLIDMRRRTPTSSSTENAIDVPVQAPIDSMVPVSKVSVLASELAAFFAKLMSYRRVLHKYQSRKVKAVVGFLLTKGPVKAVRKLLDFGGGKQNVKTTVALTAALTICLVRPLAHFAAREASNFTRGA